MRTRGVEFRATIAACLLAAAAVVLADPATQPAAATHPKDRAATIGQWVKDLADTDPNVRDKARLELMGLDRVELDTLRDKVAASRPLRPGQVVALQDIVNQVFLATEPDDPADGDSGFLGVQPAPSGVEVTPAPGVRADGMQVGVAVAARVPGFCGYRMLEDGDIILRLNSDRPHDFRNPTDLSTVVSGQRAGDTVTLDVLRRGRLIQVRITLDQKPAWVGRSTPLDALGPRLRRASDYWDQVFAPLLEDRTS